jgi:DNA-binding transcriptional LysR family regulator
VFERGLAILAEFRQLEAELDDINHLTKGCCVWAFRRWWMMMAGPISLFRQRYPGVELKISEFGGLTVQQAVTNGELDVAMTALPVEIQPPAVCTGTALRRLDEDRLGEAGGARRASSADLQRRFCPQPSVNGVV